MKSSAKLIVFQSPSTKSNASVWPPLPSHRAFLLLVAFFSATFVFTLVSTGNTAGVYYRTTVKAAISKEKPRLSRNVFDSLLHYASDDGMGFPGSRMSSAELKAIAAVLRSCVAPCNLLVFGLTRETHLWNSLNHGGRTVFVDENSYQVSKLEEEHPEIEAHDVQFTTKVSELYELMEYSDLQSKNECRPVQNLLFSDCRLAINDLPNYMYEVAWDVIIIDGPTGFSSVSPGRMTAIFTAGVLARSKSGGSDETHVFVHEIGREVEKLCSEKFLCTENLVEKKAMLGHFLVRRFMEAERTNFCSDFSDSSSSRNSTSSGFSDPSSSRNSNSSGFSDSSSSRNSTSTR